MKPRLLIFHLEIPFPPATMVRRRSSDSLAERLNPSAQPYWLRRDSVAVIRSPLS